MLPKDGTMELLRLFRLQLAVVTPRARDVLCPLVNWEKRRCRAAGQPQPPRCSVSGAAERHQLLAS